MGIELREELLHITLAYCEHERLITVIPAAPITRLEHTRHGKLRQFLTVAKDSELGLPGEHFLAPKYRCLPTLDGAPIVTQDSILCEERGCCVR